MTAEAVARAKATLEAAGYVVLREKSYRQAQERQRVAEALRVAEQQAAESARAWARDCLAQERRMRDRIAHLYGVARAHGATDQELRGVEGAAHELDDMASDQHGYPVDTDRRSFRTAARALRERWS